MTDKNRKAAHDAVREKMISEHDSSSDGKLEKMINALRSCLFYGPLDIDDVREEVGAFYPGWFTGCDVLACFLEEMPKTAWVDLSCEPPCIATSPFEEYSKCEDCGGTGRVESNFQSEDTTQEDTKCDSCNGDGVIENYLEEVYEVDVAEALLGELKGYVGRSTHSAQVFLKRYWNLPNWRIKRMREIEK